jgi:hypothetical protein
VLSKARAGELFQALFFRRRHQPRRPTPATIRPGNPAPAMGPGFDDLSSAMTTFGHQDYASIVAKDEESFLDRTKTVMLVSSEARIV